MTLAKDETVCLLDSSGVGHLGSHLLIAGIRPVEIIELAHLQLDNTLAKLDELVHGDLATVFTISYDFGRRLQSINERHSTEPDVFAARFDCLVVHDYLSGKTFFTGNSDSFESFEKRLRKAIYKPTLKQAEMRPSATLSNFTRAEYIDAVEKIKEYIRAGDTYQTNLTQKLTVQTTKSPEQVFIDLRRDHPAPFAAFIKRPSSTVISASPERFFKIGEGIVTASPIKGTRRRGKDTSEDAALRKELLASEKDRAENTMIVDLMRNDLGRVCEYGSVEVEKLCDLEEHPTLFHLVSTIQGTLRRNTKFSEIIKATFPCGSITGAPKIRTMEIIDRLEPNSRGLSMGAIGVYVPNRIFKEGRLGPNFENWGLDIGLELSVAIRTMTMRDGEASFNVGGGVTIDSDPQSEYDES
ncbi:MAG TPA: aminodeoxychorismate synthase component I, partial [Pyrinomonadaceae bacterium]|nr:aminodeoxychorismate synthase component I [Pyrinomonadaceae bacterium]